MNKLLLFCVLIISVFLYFTASDIYSLSYCYVCFAFFLLAFIVLYKEKCRSNLICFEFIFTIAFFFTNYVYPLFYYPVTPYFSLFLLDFPEEFINKGCALATIGYISFALGSLSIASPRHVVSFDSVQHKFRVPSYYVPIAILLILLLIISLFPILLSGVYDGNWGEGAFFKVIADIFIFYLIFAKLTQGSPIKDIISKNKLLILFIICYVIEITLIGNRGLFIRIIFLILLLYTRLYGKLNSGILFLCIFVGMFLLYYVGAVRGGGTYEGLDNGMPIILEVGKDLTINNRSLYVLMDYYEQNGPNFGKTWLMNILSVLPFAQSFFVNLTGISLRDINSASLVTDLYYKGSSVDMIGLGTNLIGDVFICFGLFGVIFFLYSLGKLLSYVYSKGMNGDMLSLFIYAMLFMDCIILTRSTFLTSIRPILWGLALYYFSRISINLK